MLIWTRNTHSARLHRRSQLLLVAGGAFGILAMIAIVATLLFVARNDAMREADRSASNLIQLIDADIRRTFETFDRVLLEIIRSDRFRQDAGLSPDARHALLFAGMSAIQHLGAILRLDKHGNVIEDSSALLPRVGNFADRAYFTAQRDGDGAGLYISQPFRPRFGDRAWRLALSRRVSSDDGEFDGVVVAGLRASYFGDAFNKLDLGKYSTVSILNTEGKMLARRGTFTEDDIAGTDFSHKPNFKAFLADGGGSLLSTSQLDGKRRFYRFSRLGPFPLITVVALSLDDALATWRRAVWLIGGATAALSLGGASLIVLVSRRLRLQQDSEAELTSLAVLDSLTGLFNRRHFTEAFAGEFRRSLRAQEALAVIMIDVDHFKTFNDMFGHPVGDEALKVAAAAIHATVRRPGDCAARYGGEEFIVMLADTGIDGALKVAELIRARIAAAAPVAGATRGVTVSIGVSARIVDGTTSPDCLVREADSALYDAKSSGRNRVVCFDPAAYERRDARASGGTLPSRLRATPSPPP